MPLSHEFHLRLPESVAGVPGVGAAPYSALAEPGQMDVRGGRLKSIRQRKTRRGKPSGHSRLHSNECAFTQRTTLRSRHLGGLFPCARPSRLLRRAWRVVWPVAAAPLRPPRAAWAPGLPLLHVAPGSSVNRASHETRDHTTATSARPRGALGPAHGCPCSARCCPLRRGDRGPQLDKILTVVM